MVKTQNRFCEIKIKVSSLWKKENRSSNISKQRNEKLIWCYTIACKPLFNNLLKFLLWVQAHIPIRGTVSLSCIIYVMPGQDTTVIHSLLAKTCAVFWAVLWISCLFNQGGKVSAPEVEYICIKKLPAWPDSPVADCSDTEPLHQHQCHVRSSHAFVIYILVVHGGFNGDVI